MTDGKNGWVRLLLPWLISSLVGGLLAFGAMRAELSAVKAELSGKASQPVVDAQYHAILERLNQIQQDIRELRSRQR